MKLVAILPGLMVLLVLACNGKPGAQAPTAETSLPQTRSTSEWTTVDDCVTAFRATAAIHQIRVVSAFPTENRIQEFRLRELCDEEIKLQTLPDRVRWLVEAHRVSNVISSHCTQSHESGPALTLERC